MIKNKTSKKQKLMSTGFFKIPKYFNNKKYLHMFPGRKKIMNKKNIMILSTILILFSIFSGCITSDNSNTDMIDLKQISLKIDELNNTGYESFDEIHVTEAYVAAEGTLFEGWDILEKYNIRYNEDDAIFIIQTIGKLLNSEKSDEFINHLKNANLSYDFTEINMDKIGQKSYLGMNETVLFEENSTLYLVAYKIENIVVILLGSNIPKETVINYAKIVEENIEEKL